MAQFQGQRKLAAILAADVVGYSRLMALDELGTHSRLKSVLAELFRPTVKRHGGRIFKMMGDGALVEFTSVNQAVDCAVELQTLLEKEEQQDSEDVAIKMRIGISLGDVIVAGTDLFGNGVNVAARMESLAEPGSVCISGNVREHLNNSDTIKLIDLGPCLVKNIPQPVQVFQVRRNQEMLKTPAKTLSFKQDIQFCETPDGVQIAYATTGEGPPVVSVSNWLTHLELDVQIPMRREFVRVLSPNKQVIRYDARGSGLSDREVEDFSLNSSVLDLTTVIDALGLEQVSLVGQSQGAAVAAAFAARNPNRVNKMVLCGGYARGRRMRGSKGQIAESDAFITLIREGWGKELDAYVRMFGAFFMPDANADQLSAFTNLQRKATPPENAASIQLAIDSIDISTELSNVQASTLVFHVREDARAPFEEGRRMAAGIPNARFIPLEGRNHVMLADDPSLERFLNEVSRFLEQ
ncbi:Adenylate cyclase, class 3 [Shimia gijangensis]|uniref:Adenylate cyclase, class 3 n=1 Tax=Shimia gijangensis TaxID=1470563 RepID=A0A1M6SWH3_9RHOB|nr:alpha/beta fold hydrolase [Shimia gijangensis]SHK49065.1 Adenylate cyclase, class 3 [Shimia gijangensis]